MSYTKFQMAVERFEQAAIELSWKGSKEPGEHRAIDLEYEEARRLLMMFDGGGDRVRPPSVFAEEWPIGTPVERRWGETMWRPGTVIGYTSRRIRVRMEDNWGGVSPAHPSKLRKVTS